MKYRKTHQPVWYTIKEKPWSDAYNITWDWRKNSYGQNKKIKKIVTLMSRTGIMELTLILNDAIQN